MLDGHFDFGNGYHGRLYLNPHQLFRYPSTIWRFAQDLIDVLPASVLDADRSRRRSRDGRRAARRTRSPACSTAAAPSRGTPTMFAPFMVDRVSRRRPEPVLPAADRREECADRGRRAEHRTDAGALRDDSFARPAATVIATAEIYDRMEATSDVGAPNFALAEYKAPENYPAAAVRCARPACR